MKTVWCDAKRERGEGGRGGEREREPLELGSKQVLRTQSRKREREVDGLGRVHV
jgi:hypothetical protein